MAELTDRRKAFIEHYLTCWNRTEAARRAGYAQPGMEGSRLMKNDEISRAIKDRLGELHMTADEVLTRLADHARGSLEDFITDDGEIDHKQAREAAKMHLLKKYRKTRRYFKGELSEESVEIELHDAQSALALLGRHHQLFTDKVDVTSDGKPLPIAIVKMDVDAL